VVKTVKRLLCFILMFRIIIGLCPLIAGAETTKYVYKLENLPENTWVTVKYFPIEYNSDSTSYIYKLYRITVPAGGYVNIQLQYSGSDFSIGAYKSIKKDRAIENNRSIMRENLYNREKNLYWTIRDGTYYLYPMLATVNQVKLKWTFVKCSNTVTNYCMSRAKTLPQAKKSFVFFDYGTDEADRWFKVNLLENKRLSIYGSHIGSLYVFKPNGKNVRTDHVIDYTENGPRAIYRTGTLPKGHYYIRIDGCREMNLDSDEGWRTPLSRVAYIYWR